MKRNDGIDLDSSMGYLVKEVASALRAAMEDVLRPLGMNITHYSCLELLAQRPGSSNSDLARGTFVTRQSMNVLLQTLERDGEVARAERPSAGKTLPTELTPHGRRRLAAATAAVREVELRMLSGLDEATQTVVFAALRGMASSLRAATPDAPPAAATPDAGANAGAAEHKPAGAGRVDP